MTDPVSETPLGSSREETVIEWLQRNSTALIVTVAVVLVGTGVYWYHNRSVELKDQAAERALNTALQSVSAGNQALAQSDLQKVADQYGDTQSGIEAGMLLAQMDYNAGKFDDGIGVLQKLLNSSAADMDAASLNGLIGDGQMQAKRPPAAAAAYQKAADAAPSDADKAFQLSKAARAYLAAGDSAHAKGIWQTLSKDEKNQGVAAEAKVRLGELEATPATKG